MSEKTEYIMSLTDQISDKLDKIKKSNGETEESFKKTEKAGKKMEGSFKGMTGSFIKGSLAIMGISSAIDTVGKSLKYATKTVFDFSGASAKLRAVVQPTKEQFNNLEKAALNLGSTTAFTASQVMNAFTEQAKLGQSVNEVIASSQSVLNLAAMAQLELSEAAETTVQTLNQFGMSADDTNRVVDVMAKSFTSSALDARKFAESMKYAGTIGKESGEDVESVTAILSVLADRAIDASMAGTGTRRVLLELANANSKASKALRESGSSAQTVEEKLQDLNKMNLSVTDTTEMFGMIASTAAKVLIDNADVVKDLSTQYENANESAEKMAEVMLDSLPGAITKMNSALEGLTLEIMNKFAPAIKTSIEYVTELATQWKSIFSSKDIDLQNERAANIIKETQALKQLRSFCKSISFEENILFTCCSS